VILVMCGVLIFGNFVGLLSHIFKSQQVLDSNNINVYRIHFGIHKFEF